MTIADFPSRVTKRSQTRPTIVSPCFNDFSQTYIDSEEKDQLTVIGDLAKTHDFCMHSSFDAVTMYRHRFQEVWRS
jgi:hypothetical protein